MSSDAAELVREYWRLWAARDKAGALGLMSDEPVYALHVDQDVLPFAGETRGRAAISDRLQTILDIFDTLRYEGTLVRLDRLREGERVHGQVSYCFRHKVTGEAIDGTMRQDIVVRAGRIESWREYTDAARVRAFMRLVSYRAETRHRDGGQSDPSADREPRPGRAAGEGCRWTMSDEGGG